MKIYLAKFDKDLANVVKTKVEELKGKIILFDKNGVVIFESNLEKEIFLEKIPEITRIWDVNFLVDTNIDKIIEYAVKLSEKIPKNSTFAVRTVRRGINVGLTSMEINSIVGAKILEKRKDLTVNLSNPDFVIAIEIFEEKTAICLVKGEEYEYKKYIGKKNPLEFLKKIVIVQLVYWGEGSYKMGERIGRACQSFEINELILVLHRKFQLNDIFHFLRGILDGIKSRYEVQRKSYGRKVEKIKVSIWDLYQTIYDIKADKHALIIITDPRGKPLYEIKDELKERIKNVKRIYIINGSREGIPVGLFRFADYVLDLCPHITYPTELAPVVPIITLLNLYLENES